MKLSRFGLITFFLFTQIGLLSAQTPPPPARTATDGWQPSHLLNEQLPHWLEFSGSYRTRIESQNGVGFRDASDGHILGRLHVNLKVKPTQWLTFFSQGQDSRSYLNGIVAKTPPLQNAWELRQLWGEFGNEEKYRFKVRVGRQELAFGEQRLVGSALWSNTPRVFDAVLASVAFSRARVDAFASSAVNPIDGELDHHKQGNPLYGLYGSATKLVPKATLEGYLFWRLAPASYSAVYASGARGHLDEKTFGVRFVGKLPAGFDYGIEMARQTGSLGTSPIGAWAGHWVFARTLNVKWKPRLLGEFNYASGSADPTGAKISTFDQLYPTSHDKLGLDDQVGWRNVRDLRTGVELKPIARLTIAAIYHDLWLANAHDGLYNSNGALLARSLAGTAGTHIGHEFDIQVLCNYRKTVQFGAGFGHLFTGEFIRNTTPGGSYNFPYVMATYVF